MIFLGEGVYLEILHPNNDTNKEGSTFLTKPLFPQKREDVPPVLGTAALYCWRTIRGLRHILRAVTAWG